MSALTEAEARGRAALIDVESYDVTLDLTVDPVRSRTEIRFGCREPGAATFAELTATTVLSATLNGQPAGPVRDGRLELPGLAARNVVAVEAEVAYSGTMRGLTRFTDPADGATYLMLMGYPTAAPSVYCCFDQPDLTAVTTLSLMLPNGWDCVTNGPVRERPEPGRAGTWRFEPVRGMRSYELTIAAGPYTEVWRGSAGSAGVLVSLRRRPSLADAEGVANIARFGQIARQALESYERILGVPCPYPKLDIAFVPGLGALATCFPGLMLVNEILLARMSDPDSDFVANLGTHEVAHLWFGGQVSIRWWADLWLDEAMATYLSNTAEVDTATDPWTVFGYLEKPGAYAADELPGRQPVSSPVASAADALFRLPALTYAKGAAVIRQLGALIGQDALHRGLSEYLRRFGGGGASLDDLVACWSQSADRDLTGWAESWLRTEGASTLRAGWTSGGGDGVRALVVEQDMPRTHRIGIGLYDLDGDKDGGRLRRRRVIDAEISGARTEVPWPAGEAEPDAIVLNDGDLTYAVIEFDERTLGALARSAMDLGEPKDPRTEAVCWNAVWRMVTTGALAGADFAGLVVRRLRGPEALRGPGGLRSLPVAGLEVLIGRAVSCADGSPSPDDRGRLRGQVAEACLEGSMRATPGSPEQQALAAGFAASAYDDGQLDRLRSWLAGEQLAGVGAVDVGLRGRILRTLAERGLADEADLDQLARLDPVGGERARATGLASRPDAAAKEQSWAAVLAVGQDWRIALAYANGFWVPGQQELVEGYRDRYFREALPALEGREIAVMRNLARALYPATLAGPETLAAAEAALDRGDLSQGMRLIVLERDAIMRSVLAARSVKPRW